MICEAIISFLYFFDPFLKSSIDHLSLLEDILICLIYSSILAISSMDQDNNISVAQNSPDSDTLSASDWGVYKHWTGLLEWWNNGMVE